MALLYPSSAHRTREFQDPALCPKSLYTEPKYMKKIVPGKTVAEYLADYPPATRKALGQIRAAIKAAAPKATEKLSYGIPCFSHIGHPLVGYGAAKMHHAFYVMSTKTIATNKTLLKSYSTSAGTIRLPLEEVIPTSLIKKLTKLRIKEVEMRFGKSATRRK